MLKSLYRDKSGNIAMMFATVVSLIFLGIGAAIDYSMMAEKKQTYQDYADAAALAAASSGETDLKELKKIVKQTIAANNFTGAKLRHTLVIGQDGTFHVTVDSNEETVLMGLFGKNKIPVSVMASAPPISTSQLEIALVLDTTYSMSGTRMETLKTAATDLLSKLESFGTENIKVSIVPFAQHVKIAKELRDEPWMDVMVDGTETGSEVCYMRKDITGTSNCVTAPYTYDRDGVPYTYDRTTCDYEYGPEYEYCYIPTFTWNGCVGSRTEPWDSRPEYAGNVIPGVTSSCSSEIQPLTNDFGVLKSKVTSFYATGETYMPAGLMWGWRTLETEAPFTESSTDPNVHKVIIFMTDGANTKSKLGDVHTGSDSDAANVLTKKVCTGVKDDGIIVFSIAYEITDFAAKKLVSECATTSKHHFDADNAARLISAFERIGNSLNDSVRLSH